MSRTPREIAELVRRIVAGESPYRLAPMARPDNACHRCHTGYFRFVRIPRSALLVLALAISLAVGLGPAGPATPAHGHSAVR